MKITLSKAQWEFIGKKAGWMKKAQESRSFKWEDGQGNVWDILYRNIEPEEIYSNGIALSDRKIIELMILDIQDASGNYIGKGKVVSFLNKFPLLLDEFFEKVHEINKIYEEERRIEERQIEQDPDGFFQR